MHAQGLRLVEQPARLRYGLRLAGRCVRGTRFGHAHRRAHAGQLFGADRLPALHVAGAVVVLQHGAQHLRRPQPHAESLGHGLPGPGAGISAGRPGRRVGRQKGQDAGRQRLDVERLQGQLADRREQGGLRQMLGEQPRQVIDLLSRLRRAHRQLAPGPGGPGAKVVLPTQHHSTHAGMAGHQPGLQAAQQHVGSRYQGRGRVDPPGQFEPLIKHVGQGHPGVGLGLQAIGPVERLQKGTAKTPGQPGSRQAAHLAQGSTAQPLQHRAVCRDGAERVQGQRIELIGQSPIGHVVAHRGRLHSPLASRGRLRPDVARPGQRRQASRRPGQRLECWRPTALALMQQGVAQGFGPAEQAQAGGDLQQHRALDASHPRRELQRPPSQRQTAGGQVGLTRRPTAPRRSLVSRPWKDRQPQHEQAPLEVGPTPFRAGAEYRQPTPRRQVQRVLRTRMANAPDPPNPAARP